MAKKKVVINYNSYHFTKAVKDAIERQKKEPNKWRFHLSFFGETEEDGVKEIEISMSEVPQNKVYGVKENGVDGCVVLSGKEDFKSANKMFWGQLYKNIRGIYGNVDIQAKETR